MDREKINIIDLERWLLVTFIEFKFGTETKYWNGVRIYTLDEVVEIFEKLKAPGVDGAVS